MESSSPAWLAKDSAAQKHLGKYKQDPLGLVWYVFAIDTSRKGDVVRLRRVEAVPVPEATNGEKPVVRKHLQAVGCRRSVPLKKLERDYKDVADDAGLNKIAEDADASADRLMAGFSAQLRGIPLGRGMTAVKGKSS